jgi:hypothetical protein
MTAQIPQRQPQEEGMASPGNLNANTIALRLTRRSHQARS